MLVTLADVRGHAPREAGTKMVVAARETWGSVGGGNLEETAIARARALLDAGGREPESLIVSLTDKAHADHGRQCCGGEVTLLLEPLPVGPGGGGLRRRPRRAGAGADPEPPRPRAAPRRLPGGVRRPRRAGASSTTPATVHVHHAPLPEVVLGEVPRGTHVLVMTHDHAEDFALCDAALRCAHLAASG